MSVREMSVKSGFTPSVGGKRVLHSLVSALIAGVVIGIFHILREQNQLWDNCSPEELDDRMNIMHIASCGFFVLSTGSSFLLYRTPSAPQDKAPIHRRGAQITATPLIGRQQFAALETDPIPQTPPKQHQDTAQTFLSSVVLEDLKPTEDLSAIYRKMMRFDLSTEDRQHVCNEIHQITNSWDQLMIAAFDYSLQLIKENQESVEANNILNYLVERLKPGEGDDFRGFISGELPTVMNIVEDNSPDSPNRQFIAPLKRLLDIIQPLYDSPLYNEE